jgi:hypothetical protein
VLDELARLLRHSAIYGLAGLASRIASVILLPFLTRALGPSSYGRIETMVALIALLVPLLRAGVATAFFRFYYERDMAPDRGLVVRTSFWFTVLGAGAGLVVGLVAAPALASYILGGDAYANLVRIAFAVLAVNLLYEQLTALYRVEERSVAYTVGEPRQPRGDRWPRRSCFVLVADEARAAPSRATGTGTAVVLAALIWQRRLGARARLRPATSIRRIEPVRAPAPAAGLAIWVVRLRRPAACSAGSPASTRSACTRSGVKIASAMVLVQLAFRTAWPAFAYSLRRARGAPHDSPTCSPTRRSIGVLAVARASGLLHRGSCGCWTAPEFQEAATRSWRRSRSRARCSCPTRRCRSRASRANRTDRFWRVAWSRAPS